MKLSVIFIFFFNLIALNESARILAVVPTPALSHQIAFRPLTQELAKRGHEVVIITAFPAFPKGETPANLTEIDVSHTKTVWNQHVSSFVSGKSDDWYVQTKNIYGAMLVTLEKQLQSKEVQELFRNDSRQFDLLLIEAMFTPALIYSHIFKAPVIQISPLTSFYTSLRIVGAPIHPILYPLYLNRKIYNLSFWDKLNEIYNFLYFLYTQRFSEPVAEGMFKRVFGSNVPTMDELKNNVIMFFVNTYPIWENNRPVPPGVVYIGGVSHKPAEELSRDLQEYLDASKNGVIYVSFGTTIDPNRIAPEKIQIFLKVFAKLPYNILWKWNEELPVKHKNVRTYNWLPQTDILRHPNIKLFITQGGLHSTEEAIGAGVPVIVLPMLFDQWYNAEQCAHHKLGLKLEMETISDEVLNEAINTVIEDKSYKINVLKLKSIISDQLQPSLDRAVWWTEYALRHGNEPQIRSPAANMPWTQYFMLDIFIPILIVCLLIFVTFVFVLGVLIKLFYRKNTSQLKVKTK